MGIEVIGKIINQKSIGLSGDIHKEIKTFCKKNGVKISWLIEELFVNFKKNGGDTVKLKEENKKK